MVMFVDLQIKRQNERFWIGTEGLAQFPYAFLGFLFSPES